MNSLKKALNHEKYLVRQIDSSLRIRELKSFLLKGDFKKFLKINGFKPDFYISKSGSLRKGTMISSSDLDVALVVKTNFSGPKSVKKIYETIYKFFNNFTFEINNIESQSFQIERKKHSLRLSKVTYNEDSGEEIGEDFYIDLTPVLKNLKTNKEFIYINEESGSYKAISTNIVKRCHFITKNGYQEYIKAIKVIMETCNLPRRKIPSFMLESLFFQFMKGVKFKKLDGRLISSFFKFVLKQEGQSGNWDPYLKVKAFEEESYKDYLYDLQYLINEYNLQSPCKTIKLRYNYKPRPFHFTVVVVRDIYSIARIFKKQKLFYKS